MQYQHLQHLHRMIGQLWHRTRADGFANVSKIHGIVGVNICRTGKHYSTLRCWLEVLVDICSVVMPYGDP